MKRREFIISAAGAFVAANEAMADPPAMGIAAQGRPLVPPKVGLIHVAFAISKGTTEIDYVGPQAVFQTWQEDLVTKKPSPRFRLYTVSDTREPVDGRIADYVFNDAPPPHVVVVPAQHGSQALLDWLRKVAMTADVTMSVCVGVRHLAKAGLLSGKPATSHHGAIDQLAKEFPEVKWVRGVRFVEGERISTGGGLTAGIDLALRVVERYFGRSAAHRVAEHLEYDGKGWIP